MLCLTNIVLVNALMPMMMMLTKITEFAMEGTMNRKLNPETIQ